MPSRPRHVGNSKERPHGFRLILHLSEGCPGFNSAAQAGAHLKRLVPGWDKTALRFGDFRDGVAAAVVRAKRLSEPPGANPSTAVWRVIESLRSA
jgi:hypothetical protein